MYGFISGYSGQTIFDDYYITSYNMVFTALPLAAKAIYDQDVSPLETTLNVKPFLPKLYYVGQKSTIFNIPNYLLWIMVGVCHALVIFLLPYYIYLGTVIEEKGETGDMWAFSISSFTAIIIVTRFKLTSSPYRLST